MNQETNQSKTTIVVDNVSKTYRSKSQVANSSGSKQENVFVDALKGVTFVTHTGESVGVIGQNGSGKSTLFRIMSGKDSPTSGKILVSSEPSLLGVSAAMQPHLTGVQNVELGCLAMGMEKAAIDDALLDIVKFCDIGDAIYRPLSTYSSGMKARLKFAIATCARPEILLVDEALSTGDSSFNERATERMRSFLGETGTVLVVSHSARALREICNRGIWLHLGEVVADASLTEVASMYERWSHAKARGHIKEADGIVESAKNEMVRPNIEYV